MTNNTSTGVYGNKIYNSLIKPSNANDNEDPSKKMITDTSKIINLFKVMAYETKTLPTIDKVVFNNPATVVFWNDKTKTVVKCRDNDEFNEVYGLAMAVAKKYFGSSNALKKAAKKGSHPSEKKQKKQDDVDKYIRDIQIGNVKLYHESGYSDEAIAKQMRQDILKLQDDGLEVAEIADRLGTSEFFVKYVEANPYE